MADIFGHLERIHRLVSRLNGRWVNLVVRHVQVSKPEYPESCEHDCEAAKKHFPSKTASPPLREDGEQKRFHAAVYFGNSRPGARCVTSWTIQALPSGSWKAT